MTTARRLTAVSTLLLVLATAPRLATAQTKPQFLLEVDAVAAVDEPSVG